MKIVAAPGARLSYFLGTGRIVRTRVITENGVWDGNTRTIVAPYAEVPETDYYRKAIAHGTALLCDDKGQPQKPPSVPKPAVKGKE